MAPPLRRRRCSLGGRDVVELVGKVGGDVVYDLRLQTRSLYVQEYDDARIDDDGAENKV